MRGTTGVPGGYAGDMVSRPPRGVLSREYPSLPKSPSVESPPVEFKAPELAPSVPPPSCNDRNGAPEFGASLLPPPRPGNKDEESDEPTPIESLKPPVCPRGVRNCAPSALPDW